MCFCSAQFLWFSYLCKLIYSIQLPPASLQLAACCRRIHGNKDSLHPVGCRSTGNKNTPLHVNMQGASLLSDICSADAVFIKLYSARYHSNSSHRSFIPIILIALSLFFVAIFAIFAGIFFTVIKIVLKTYSCIKPIIYSYIQKLSLVIAFVPEFFYQLLKSFHGHFTIHFVPIFLLKQQHFMY